MSRVSWSQIVEFGHLDCEETWMGWRGYPPEFRRKVLDLVVSGRAVAEVATVLGLSEHTIYTWRRQDRIDRGLVPGLTSAERAELTAAKRRISELETELAVHRRASELLGRWCPQKAVRGHHRDGFGRTPRAGDCYDNAMIESFWSRMQVELLDRRRWKTRLELANAMFDYLEIWHNRQRRHSKLGMLTPNEFETKQEIIVA